MRAGHRHAPDGHDLELAEFEADGRGVGAKRAVNLHLGRLNGTKHHDDAKALFVWVHTKEHQALRRAASGLEALSDLLFKIHGRVAGPSGHVQLTQDGHGTPRKRRLLRERSRTIIMPLRSPCESDTVGQISDSGVPRITQVVFDTTDARVSAEFWRKLLGLVYRPGHEPPDPEDDDHAGRDWLNLRTADGRPCLAFQQVDDLPRTTWPATGIPQQLHLDLTVRSIQALDAVHTRVLSLGGELRLDRAQDPDEPLRVYADPDGHTFCVFVAAD